MKRIIIFNFILVFLFDFCFSQNSKTDSLLNALSTAKQDTGRVILLYELCWSFRATDAEKALEYGLAAQQLADKLEFTSGRIQARQNLGVVYTMKGEFTKGLSLFNEALPLSKIMRSKKAEGSLLNNIGIVNMYKGDYNEAIKYYLQSLEIREAMKDSASMATSLNNISVIYYYKEDYKSALNYQLKALSIKKRISGEEQVASTQNNIGISYSHLGQYDSALYYYKSSLEILERLGDKAGQIETLLNCAEAFIEKKQLDQALTFLNRIIGLAGEMDDKRGMAAAKFSLAKVFLAQEKLELSFAAAQESMRLSRGIGDREAIMSAYEVLADIYFAKGNFKEAFLQHKNFSLLKDSILNEENSKQINEMEARFESEKKDRVLAENKAQIVMQKADDDLHVLERNAFLLGFLIVLILAFFIFKGYKGKKRANAEILIQKHHLEEKQKEILDSIYYARRIQRALITNEKYIANRLTKLQQK